MRWKHNSKQGVHRNLPDDELFLLLLAVFMLRGLAVLLAVFFRKKRKATHRSERPRMAQGDGIEPPTCG